MNKPTRPILVSLKPAPVPVAGERTPPAGHKPVLIQTDDFILRSLVPDDITPRVLGWLSDGEMMQGLNLTGLDFDLDQLRDFVRRFDNFHNYFIGIFSRADESMVGFYTIDVDHRHRTGNLTTGIGERAHIGRGTLWATIDALLDHFYAERNIEKFSARILARNFRMLFNFKDNTRFVLEACLRQECLAPSGKRLDILVFSSFKNPKPAR